MMFSQTILQPYIGSIRFKERVIEGSVSNIDRKITSGPTTARRRQVALPTRWDACSSGATRREPLRPGGGTRSRVRPDPGRAYAPSLRVVEIPLPQIHGSGMPPNVGARKHTGHAYYLAYPQFPQDGRAMSQCPGHPVSAQVQGPQRHGEIRYTFHFIVDIWRIYRSGQARDKKGPGERPRAGPKPEWSTAGSGGAQRAWLAPRAKGWGNHVSVEGLSSAFRVRFLHH